MTNPTGAGRLPHIFRGWWVLAGIFVTMTVGSDLAFYAQGVFLDALVKEQGFSVAMAGAGTSFFFVPLTSTPTWPSSLSPPPASWPASSVA